MFEKIILITFVITDNNNNKQQQLENQEPTLISEPMDRMTTPYTETLNAQPNALTPTPLIRSAWFACSTAKTQRFPSPGPRQHTRGSRWFVQKFLQPWKCYFAPWNAVMAP